MLVDDLGVRRLKFGSGELTNAPFLWNAARTGLSPLIISTGMADMDEIELALGVVAHALGSATRRPSPAKRFSGRRRRRTAQRPRSTGKWCCCTRSATIRRLDAVHLHAMTVMRERFVPVGFSDHTEGIAAAIAAAALGAAVIEKHFTLD